MLVAFDFDNTLEEFTPYESAVENEIFTKIGAKYLLDVQKLLDVFDGIKRSYAHPRALPHDYSRSVWFGETFSVFHLPEPVDVWVRYYWDKLFSLVRVFPGTFETLTALRNEGHTLIIISDSDGDAKIKRERIEHLGLLPYFDHIFTSDTAGHNKPNPRNFLQALEYYRAAAEDAVMIGDNPRSDLAPAHELGMHTIWLKQGVYGSTRSEHYEYIEHEAEDMRDIPVLVESFIVRAQNAAENAARQTQSR